MKPVLDMRATAELPTIATAMASHVRVADAADIASTGSLPSMASAVAVHVRVMDGEREMGSDPIALAGKSDVRLTDTDAKWGRTPFPRGSGRLSGAWLLESAADAASNGAAPATDDAALASDDTARASRLSDMVLQRARQGRRFA